MQSSDAPPQPSKPVVLLVEGQDDGIFLEELLTLRGDDPSKVQVLYLKGIGKLESYLKMLKKAPVFTSGRVKSLGLVLDSDESFEDKQSDLKAMLARIGLPSPNSAEVIKNGDVALGFFLLPNSRDGGELEDLILDINNGDARFKAAGEIVSQFDDDTQKFKKKSKREVQVVLAISHKDLCAGAGRGIRNGALQIEIDDVKEISDFIEEVLKQA